MDKHIILDSLREEVKRHNGLAALSQEEVMRCGHRYKADTMQAAIEIIEREVVSNGRQEQSA